MSASPRSAAEQPAASSQQHLISVQVENPHQARSCLALPCLAACARLFPRCSAAQFAFCMMRPPCLARLSARNCSAQHTHTPTHTRQARQAAAAAASGTWPHELTISLCRSEHDPLESDFFIQIQTTERRNSPFLSSSSIFNNTSLSLSPHHHQPTPTLLSICLDGKGGKVSARVVLSVTAR